MAFKINKTSWLAITQLLESHGYVFWDTPNFPILVPQAGDRFLTVDSQYIGRIDLVAFDMYGDENYWWAVALANNLDQIPTDMREGMILRIPQKSYIDSFLSKGPR